MAVAASKERSSHSISDTFDNNKRVIVYTDTDWGGVTAEGKQQNLRILACRVLGTTQKSNPNLHLARPDRLNCVVCFCADNSEVPSSPPPPLFLSFYLFFLWDDDELWQPDVCVCLRSHVQRDKD